jgi:cytochrome c553
MAASDPSGQLIAAVCANCHGSEGRSAGAIPSLDSLSAEAIGQNLAAFRSGAGEATVMSRIAKGFDDAEIAALVAYFAARGQ